MLLFCLENMKMIREGTWPRDTAPDSSTNIDPAILAPQRYIDSTEQVKGFAAEIDARLRGWTRIFPNGERVKVVGCGMAGKLLEAQVQAGLGIDDLDPDARKALNYISVRDRRLMGFIDWKKQKKYLVNTTKR
jgi:hypothetical protein